MTGKTEDSRRSSALEDGRGQNGEALVGWVTRDLEEDASFPDGVEGWIRSRLVRRLLNPARAVFIGQTLFVATAVLIAWGQVPSSTLLPWAGLLVATTAARSGIPGWLERRGARVATQMGALRWTVLLGGVAWGGGVAILAGSLSLERILLLMVALTGMVAASAVTLAPDPPSFHRFEVPLLLGLTAGLLIHGQSQTHWLAVGLVLLFGIWVQTLHSQTHSALRHQLLATAELKRHDAQAASERGYLMALLQSIPDAIVAMERGGRVLGVNRGFTETFGWETDEVLDRDLFELVVPEAERSGARSEVAELLDSEATVREVRRTRKDGEIAFMRVLTSPIHGLPNVVALLYSDITELKETETALEAARRAAEQANVAKSEFLATMSHEIRTPMNAIIGMADLLAETELTSAQREYVTVFTTAGETLLALINQILDLSRIEAGHLELAPRPFDLGDLIEQTTRLFAVPAHEKGIELTAAIDPEIARAFIGDQDRLRQVLVNLLGNAVKFTEEGEVTLRVEPDAQTGSAAAGDEVAVSFTVTDTGPGIPEDRVDAIFERFTQADSSTTRKHGGSGLGLTISAALIELMGGKIGVRSTIGEGTSFYFTLPLGASTGDEVSSSAPRTPELRGVRALVVDDNATNRFVLTQVLQGWGASLGTAEGGREALTELRRARAAGEPYGLVLLDGRMPEIDGFDVAELVREEPELAGTTLMMLTSGGDQAEEIARAEAVGIAAYLVKPVRRGELWEGIQRILNLAPPSDAASVREPSDRTEAPVGPPSGARILLVEDTEENRILIQAYLGGSPHALRMVERGEEAVQVYTETPTAFDVIFMDIQMPGIDGYEATRRIREWEQKEAITPIPIVALTAHALEEERRKSLDAGCDDHLTKPIRKDTFLEAVAAHARRRVETPAAG